jgi:hypothetical protein
VILAPPDHFPTPEIERLQMRRWRRAVALIRDLGGIVEAADPNGSEKEPTEISPDELIFLTVTLEKGWQGGGGGLVNLKRMAVRPPLPTVHKAWRRRSNATTTAARLHAQGRALPNGNGRTMSSAIKDQNRKPSHSDGTTTRCRIAPSPNPALSTIVPPVATTATRRD